MACDLITSEMIYSGLFQGFKIVFDVYYPIVLPIIIGGIIIAILKRVVKSFSFNYALVTGSTKCEAKKKSKTSSHMIDVISAVNDMNEIYKK